MTGETTTQDRWTMKQRVWFLVAASAALIAGGVAIEAVMPESSEGPERGPSSHACAEAKDDVDDVLRALALFGEDDPDFLAEYERAAAKRARACA